MEKKTLRFHEPYRLVSWCPSRETWGIDPLGTDKYTSAFISARDIARRDWNFGRPVGILDLNQLHKGTEAITWIRPNKRKKKRVLLHGSHKRTKKVNT